MRTSKSIAAVFAGNIVMGTVISVFIRVFDLRSPSSWEWERATPVNVLPFVVVFSVLLTAWQIRRPPSA
jgi:hypothetical protein